MQSTTLMIMRHAKTEWSSLSGRDCDRCLTERGQHDAPLMGRWLLSQNRIPDQIIASTAKRVEQTTLACSTEWQTPFDAIQWHPEIYNASLSVLLGLVADVTPQSASTLLIGHNPGLAELVLYLCADQLPRTALANLMPTSAVAILEIRNADNPIDYGSWECVDYTTPKFLKSNQ